MVEYLASRGAEVLRRAFDLVMREKEYLAQLITLENGKSLADARSEVAYAAEFFRWYAEEAVRSLGDVSRAPASGARILVQHKPAGIALLITPWNFPLAMATRKIGPALAAGCTVIAKPASETPLTMLALMPLLEKAGVPAGVVNVLPSRRSGQLTDTLLQDIRVRVLSFTGSAEVGQTLLRSAAQNVVRSVMELGGNAHFHRIRGCRHRSIGGWRHHREDAQHGRGLHCGEPLPGARVRTRCIRNRASLNGCEA